MQLKRILILVGLVFTLIACGQKGPLMLKEPTKTTDSKSSKEDKAKASKNTTSAQKTSKE